MNLAQIVQSHALSFFHLSAPDLLLGLDSDPAKRNIFGLIAAEPDLARGGIRLRQFGQEIIELLGGKKIHPAWSVPGGVREPLTERPRSHPRAASRGAATRPRCALSGSRSILDTLPARKPQIFGNFPSLFMGLVGNDGTWEHYDGNLRFVDGDGQIVADQLDPARYQQYIGEAVEPDSYLKSPYYKPLGYPDGIYRVGPLARLNVCTHMGTPAGRPGAQGVSPARPRRRPTSSFFYHYARLIEILAALELIERLLDDPDLPRDHLRAEAGINQLRRRRLSARRRAGRSSTITRSTSTA